MKNSDAIRKIGLNFFESILKENSRSTFTVFVVLVKTSLVHKNLNLMRSYDQLQDLQFKAIEDEKTFRLAFPLVCTL